MDILLEMLPFLAPVLAVDVILAAAAVRHVLRQPNYPLAIRRYG